MANSVYGVLPQIVAKGRAEAQPAAVASLASYTVGADSSFLVYANVLVTTATNHSFTVTVAYTDEGNTSRTITITFWMVTAGTTNSTIANATGAVPYHGFPYAIRCKSGTTITIATTGTFTTVVYNVEGFIVQTA